MCDFYVCFFGGGVVVFFLQKNNESFKICQRITNHSKQLYNFGQRSFRFQLIPSVLSKDDILILPTILDSNEIIVVKWSGHVYVEFQSAKKILFIAGKL